VESTVCVGTKFYIFLPASTRLLVHTPTTALEENEAVPRVGRGKILVMDDEKVIGKIAGRMINRLGYKFEIAVNGENAIEQFLNARTLNQPFDLVILDLTIRGGMGGRDVIKTLLEIDQQTRAIVSSGYSNDPIMANFENYGFKGVIVKPYKFETLRDTIEQFLPRV
jgi:CheY-like chemotaxis protein